MTDQPQPPETPHGPHLRTVAMPRDANPSGDIFGGWTLSQMDLAGGTFAAGLPWDGGNDRDWPDSSMATKVNTPSVTFSAPPAPPRPRAQVSMRTVSEVSPVLTMLQ